MKMNVSIRPWQMSDAADIAAIINNKKIQDNLRDGIPFPYTENDGADFINNMLNAKRGSTFAFAIIVDDKIAGSIGAFRQENIHSRTAELGYYVGEEYWCNGVCTTAVKLLCRYVFDNTDIIRIYAEPFAYNAASCRVLEKAGFKYEGTLRSNAIKNDEVLDMKMYGFIRIPANDFSQMTLAELWQLFPIELAEYNPEWAVWYEDEKATLQGKLGDAVKQIDHIGSTSVEGLLAKPIVDILLQVSSDCDFDWLKSTLLADGWLLMSERISPDIHSDWNKGYTPSGFDERVFHLHIREVGDWDELYFRDYLAAHPKEAAAYEAIKRKLAIENKYNRDAYTEAKGDFIKDCSTKARRERQQK
jgi:RimJ/RimL family protein N-acetyltransferase/GrpB-like predicted nucleotidyltransferase (UPF0157 family)